MPKSQFSEPYARAVEALTSARAERGVTQAAVAEALGLRQTDISKIERRERRIDLYEFYMYARAIGADPVDLFRLVASEFDAQGG